MTREEVLRKFRSADPEKLKAIVGRRHPVYKDALPHWEFCESTYGGGPAWFKENIFRYHKEGSKEYTDRKGRAYRFNHTREAVDLINKYIFKAPINRKVDDAPDQIRRFWQNSTLYGRNIDHFMRQVAERSSIYGRSYVVVDTNNSGDGTLLEEKQNGVRVYAYAVKPQNMLDISYDDQGSIRWALVRETSRDDASPLDSGDVQSQYRLWTPEYWVLFRAKKDEKTQEETIEVADANLHGAGLVPIIESDHIVHDGFYHSPSLIDDVAYLDRAVANYLSNLDAIIQDQTFSQLIIPAQAMMTDDDEGEKKLIELGTKRIFTYDAQAQLPPEFISPDPKQANVIITVVNKIISEIYHSIGMAGERTKQDNAVGIDNSSGVAKAYDFERMNSMLAAKAQSLEETENRLVKLVAAWSGATIDPDEKLVSYPSDFDVRSLYDEFEIGQRLAVMDAPDIVRKEQMKQLVDKLFPRLSRNLIEKMREEIDADWPDLLAKLDSETASLKGIPGISTPAKENEQGQNNDGDKSIQ